MCDNSSSDATLSEKLSGSTFAELPAYSGYSTGPRNKYKSKLRGARSHSNLATLPRNYFSSTENLDKVLENLRKSIHEKELKYGCADLTEDIDRAHDSRQRQSQYTTERQRGEWLSPYTPDRPLGTYTPDEPPGTYTSDEPRGDYTPDKRNGTYTPDKPRGTYTPDKPLRTYTPDRSPGTYTPDRPPGTYTPEKSSGRSKSTVNEIHNETDDVEHRYHGDRYQGSRPSCRDDRKKARSRSQSREIVTSLSSSQRPRDGTGSVVVSPTLALCSHDVSNKPRDETYPNDDVISSKIMSTSRPQWEQPPKTQEQIKAQSHGPKWFLNLAEFQRPLWSTPDSTLSTSKHLSKSTSALEKGSLTRTECEINNTERKSSGKLFQKKSTNVKSPSITAVAPKKGILKKGRYKPESDPHGDQPSGDKRRPHVTAHTLEKTQSLRDLRGSSDPNVTSTSTDCPIQQSDNFERTPGKHYVKKGGKFSMLDKTSASGRPTKKTTTPTLLSNCLPQNLTVGDKTMSSSCYKTATWKKALVPDKNDLRKDKSVYDKKLGSSRDLQSTRVRSNVENIQTNGKVNPDYYHTKTYQSDQFNQLDFSTYV